MSGMFLFREFDYPDPEDHNKYNFNDDDDSDEECGPIISSSTLSSPSMSPQMSSGRKPSMSPKMLAAKSPLIRPSQLRTSSSVSSIQTPPARTSRMRSSSASIPEPMNLDSSTPIAPITTATPQTHLLAPKNTASLVPASLPSRSRSLAPGDENTAALLKIRALDPRTNLVSQRRASTVGVVQLATTDSKASSDSAPISLNSSTSLSSSTGISLPVTQPKSILKKSSKSLVDVTSSPDVQRPRRGSGLTISTTALQTPTTKPAASERAISKSAIHSTAKVSELNVSTNNLLLMLDLDEKEKEKREEEKRKLLATQEAFRARYEQTFGRRRSMSSS